MSWEDKAYQEAEEDYAEGRITYAEYCEILREIREESKDVMAGWNRLP